MKENIQAHYPVHSSASCWPNDQKYRDELSLPITLSFNPLQMSPHQASFPSNKINSFRCHSCKAFANYLCTIRSDNQYDCSICGCTNRVPTKLNKDSPEFTVPIYSCITTNPTQQSDKQTCRNYIFALDLTTYEPQSTFNFNFYTITAIKQFCKQVEEGSHPPCKITIITFNDFIQEYSVNSAGQVEMIVNTHMETLMSGNQIEICIPEHKDKVFEILEHILSSSRGLKNEVFSSQAFLKTVEKILVHFQKSYGKIFIISGLRTPPGLFETGILEQPEQFQSNFTLNKKKCLPTTIEEALETTQLSVNFYIYNRNFINAMPLYVISKTTNGELKNYYHSNYTQFYYQFAHTLCQQTSQMGTQTILKVRNSTGLKLVGIFGQYRQYRGSNDQVQLISCPSSRAYMFQFIIQGKVQQNSLNVQFSVLWTDEQGRRVFKVVTHKNRVSGDCQEIIRSVNYGQVNNSYLQAVLHNMDLNVRVRNLQLTLQERCRKHIRAIQKYEGANSESIKKASSYIIFTFFLMRHFIMNTKFAREYIYDKSIQTKSRILTSDVSGIHNIWPAVYNVNNDSFRIADMRYEDLKLASQAVVIDQGCYCYVYICDRVLRDEMGNKSKLDIKKSVFDLISEKEGLSKTKQLLDQIREQKLCGYSQVVLMQSLQGACIFDEKGPLSYENFLDIVTAQ